MPTSKTKEVSQFLDGVAEEKLENFAAKEKTIYEDKRLGMRLDHQGVNNSDGLERIYIQPLRRGKSTISRNMSSNNVVAQAHAWPTTKPDALKKALIDSASKDGALMHAKK